MNTAWISRSSCRTSYWVRNLLSGIFGLSLEYQRPNAELIGAQLGLTLALALMAFVLTWLIAVPAGIYSATHQRSVLDHVITVINYMGVATPNFMLALILMWIAFAYFGISITGLYSPEYADAPWSIAQFVNLLEHIWLPAIDIRHRGHRAADPDHARQFAR